MTSFIKKNYIILFIILILGLYLGIKALNSDGWDGWGFGSAETLMSSRYWAKDGFAKNYFLFLPRPYSKLIHYFDEPEFRNRSIQTVNGELSRDRRLYYTHYPPGYLIPYALIAKSGIENRAVFRIFSLWISLAALLFFYLFIKEITNKSIAIIASIYYGFSVTFLNYADSVSTQPWTILFAFLILYFSILSRRDSENPKNRRYNLWIWPAYFALSLSSYDATFFVFAFLVLSDIFIAKKFLWKKWLFFASAPVSGFALQIFQNARYLGWQGMIGDFHRYYAERAIGSFKNFIAGLAAPFVSLTGIKTFYFFKKSAVAFAGGAAITGILWKLRQKTESSRNFFRFVFIFAAAAIIQPFFINVTGLWPYQGVLTAPFWGLIIGVSSVAVWKMARRKIIPNQTGEKILFAVLAIVAAAIWLYRISDTSDYAKQWPNNKPNRQVIDFSKEIKRYYPNEEKIMFRIYPKNPEWKSQFPVFNFEYYAGMPVIDFADSKDLPADFRWLRGRSEYPFYSFIIAENKSDTEKIRRELIAQNIKNISPVTDIQGQKLFIVGPK